MKPVEPVGFSVIACRSGSSGPALLPPRRLNAVCEQLMLLFGSYDRMVINHGAGVDRTIQALNSPRGTCLVVTTYEPTALTGAYAFTDINLTERCNTVIRVVVNLRGADS